MSAHCQTGKQTLTIIHKSKQINPKKTNQTEHPLFFCLEQRLPKQTSAQQTYLCFPLPSPNSNTSKLVFNLTSLQPILFLLFVSRNQTQTQTKANMHAIKHHAIIFPVAHLPSQTSNSVFRLSILNTPHTCKSWSSAIYLL